MKAFTSTLRLALIALLTGVSSLHAQWNTLNHDAVVNRGINDIFFMGSTGWAVGSRADNVPWGSRGFIYKTTDGGASWNTISLPLVVGTDSVMSLKSVQFLSLTKGFAVATCYSTNGASGIYYGAVLKTMNGGATWTTNFSAKNQIIYSTGRTTNFNHIHFSGQYNAVVSGSKTLGANTFDGIAYSTTNGGTTWTLSTVWTGTATHANASFFESNGVGSIVGGKYVGLSGPYNGRIARSVNYGSSWNTTFIDNDYRYVDIHFPTAQIGYAIGDSMYFTTPGSANGKLVKTINGGTSWTTRAMFTSFMPMCVFFTDALTGYIGGQTAAGNPGLKKTIDGGVTWTNEVYPDIANPSLITSIYFSTPVTGYAANGYTSSNSIYGSFQQACGVYAGPDTTFCQGVGPIYATPTSPGSDYVFSWSPSTGLSDSTSQTPYVLHAHNQQYVVTMTDTVTNCVATDTIVVSAYNAIVGPLILVCPGDSFMLDFGPGASNYYWQYFTDTNQVTTPINVNTQTLWVSEPGYYMGYAMFPGCGALTSMVGITDTGCVVSACAVNAGPDTTFCQQHGHLTATPASPGNYTFSWSPATGLDNPNAQNPNVISGVYNQQYVVTMTDAAQSCTATDTVIVSAYYFHVDTTYSCFPDSALLDFGPGAFNYFWQYFTDTNNVTFNINVNTQTYWATEPGRYSGIAMFTGCGALTSVFTVEDSCFAASVCAVDAGPDTTFCQQHGNLTATPASPGNYTFSWSPANGLDNPSAQNPNVITGIHNQQYVVTMYDSVTNCTATDTVIVSAYYFHVDTVYNCNGQPVLLDHGPGGSGYIWQFYTDPQGNSSFINQSTQTYWASAPGTYSGIAIFPGCGALTSVYTLIDSCNIAVGNVWPGDCNYDLTANMADALHIGLAYNATGATRPGATNGWYAQPMTDWTQNYVNCNYKHGDADGNGTIDVNDTVPISLNYSNTHPYRLAPVEVPATAPELYLVANYDTVGLQTLVTVDVRLGTTSIPVDSIYGISFKITADAGLIDTNLTFINFNSTWLGTTGSNMFNFRKYFRTNGSVDAAECRNNHINTSGNGTIGTFLIVTTDNLSGIAICHIDITDVTAVTASQHYLQLATVNDSVVIDPSVPAGIRPTELAPSFNVYPNPANSSVTIQSSITATQIEITDMLGRTISTITPSSTSTTINTAAFAEGVYLVRVFNGNAVTTQKLSVTH